MNYPGISPPGALAGSTHTFIGPVEVVGDPAMKPSTEPSAVSDRSPSTGGSGEPLSPAP
jgi:hypothetical protein